MRHSNPASVSAAAVLVWLAGALPVPGAQASGAHTLQFRRETQNLTVFTRSLGATPATAVKNGCPEIAATGTVRYGRIPHRLAGEKDTSTENFLDFAAIFPEAGLPVALVDIDGNRLLECDERVELIAHPSDPARVFRTLVIDWNDAGPPRQHRYRLTLPAHLSADDPVKYSVALVDVPVARWAVEGRSTTWILYDGNHDGMFDRTFGDGLLIDADDTGRFDLDPYGPNFRSYHLPIELPWGLYDVASVDPRGGTLELVPSATPPAATRPLTVGELVPQHRCPSRNGGEISFGGPAPRHRLLYFWSSKCGACMDDALELAPLLTRLGPEVLEVVGVSFDEDAGEFERWIVQAKVDWPQCFLGHEMWDNALAHRFGVQSPSNFVLLDPSGRLLQRGTGMAQIVPALEGLQPGKSTAAL